VPRTLVSVIQTIVCALVLGVPSFASAADVKVPRTIDFAKSASVRSAIQEQCNLQTSVSEAIASNSSDAELVDGSGNLSLEITEVHGPGGWIFSGPKWMEVSGKLSRGGKTYGFRAKRYSAFNPFGGVCSILTKCSRAIGSDIATWLQNPTDGAELGDAK
jgi:hypothetical protein